MRAALVLFTAAVAAYGQKLVTLAGTGVAGFSGDGGPGVQAQVNNPYGLTIGPDGALYFCEIGNHRVRRLDLKSGIISTAAGSGKKGYAGDGGPALAAEMNEPYEVRFDASGNLFIAEMQNHVVRRVDAKTHTISTVAGTGTAGFSGDGGPANQAQLRQPHSIAFDKDGRLLICDIGNQRIRRVDLGSGKIETWGTTWKGPRAITSDPDGNLYVVLREGNAVYRIDAASGEISHVAGTGESGYTGDSGPAKLAKLSGPKGIAWAPDGSLYLADTESHTIRRVDLKSGIIITVAGNGKRGELARPHGIFVSKSGDVYVGDSENHRVLQIKPDGKR